MLLFDEAGLLTDRCVMAHGVCLSDQELAVLAERGTAIAHCPLSNFFFADVILRVKHCLHIGVKIGLGTDVSGGYSPSMLASVRNAVIASKALRMAALSADPFCPPEHADRDLMTWKEALYLATIGGASALGLQERVGNLEVGKQFDCLVVDCGSCRVRGIDTNPFPFDVFPDDSTLDRLEKFVQIGDDRNIRHVYIGGRCLKHP